MSSSFHVRKIHEPTVKAYEPNHQSTYQSSLIALNDAWSSVAAAKEELSNVDIRIRKAAVSPVREVKEKHVGFSADLFKKRKKQKGYPSIERRIVYEVPKTKFLLDIQEENKPPVSKPQPTMKTLRHDYLVHPSSVEDKFIPTRLDLPVHSQKDDRLLDFHYATDDLNVPIAGKPEKNHLEKPVVTSEESSRALMRLKERILKQKMNASEIMDEKPVSDRIPSSKPHHLETDPVRIIPEGKTTDGSVLSGKMLTRKVAQAPQAPSYKGFNDPERVARSVPGSATYTAVNSEEVKKTQPRDVRSEALSSSRKTRLHETKAKGQSQRIIAPKKPAPLVTTSSWRLGQEVVRKLIKDMKIKESHQRSKSDGAEELPLPSLISTDLSQKDKDHAPRSGSKESHIDELRSQSDVTEKDAFTLESRSEQQKFGKKTGTRDTESEPADIEQSLSASDASTTTVDKIKALSQQAEDQQSRSASDASKTTVEKRNVLSQQAENQQSRSASVASKTTVEKRKVLSQQAEDVLKEIQSAASEEMPLDTRNDIRAVVDTGLPKNKIQKMLKKSPPLKRKTESQLHSQSKVRHYDQKEIQSYMSKQLAERKKARMEERKKKAQIREGQKRKMQDLYEKQKSAVHESLPIHKRLQYGDTFSKPRAQSPDSSFPKSGHALHEDTHTSTEASEVSRSQLSSVRLPLVTSSPRNDDNQAVDLAGSSQFVVTDRSIFIDSLDEMRLRSLQGNRGFAETQKPTAWSYADSRPKSTEDGNVENPPPLPALRDNSAIIIDGDPGTRSREDRVAAIRAAATALRDRLETETKKLNELRSRSYQSVQESSTQISSQSQAAQTLKPAQTYSIATTGLTSASKDLIGELPGTRNVDEQAELNATLKSMETAACKIQAVYRGHSVRQGLGWKLPSGRTLFQTLEEARRRAMFSNAVSKDPLRLTSDGYPPINRFSTVTKGYTEEEPGALLQASSTVSTFGKEAGKTKNKTKSSISRSSATFTGRSFADDPSVDTSSISNPSTQVSFPSYSDHIEDDNEQLRKILQRRGQVSGDRYSVINIFARNYPSLRKQQLLDASYSDSNPGTETENILADAYQHEQELVSRADTDVDADIIEQDIEDAVSDASDAALALSDLSGHHDTDRANLRPDRILSPSPTSISASKSKSAIARSKASAPASAERHPSVAVSSASEPESEKLFTPRSRTPEILSPKFSLTDTVHARSANSRSKFETSFPKYGGKVRDGLDSDVSSEHSTTLVQSRAHSSDSFSDADMERLDPILSSTKRSSPPEKAVDAAEETPLSRYVQFARGDRMSPNTLERRLRAEINLFDTVGDSLQQLSDLEKVRSVTMAQQETVSLAQFVKERQVAHQRELERLSFEAKERALLSKQEVEKVHLATAEAASSAAKVLAEMKAESCKEIAESAKQLLMFQNEASKRSMELEQKLEQVRLAASRSSQEAAGQQTVDVASIASAAASAASRSAVEVALQHHRDQLEQLKAEAFEKVSKAYADAVKSSANVQNPVTARTATSDLRSLNQVTKRHSPVSVGSNTKSSDLQKSSSASSHYDDDFTAPTLQRTGLQVSQSAESISEEKPSAGRSLGSVTDSSGLAPSSASAHHSVNLEPPYQQRDSRARSSHATVSTSASGSPYASLKSQAEAHKLQTESVSLALGGSPAAFAEDESIRSEDHFHSSLTEEELKHEFRMVLPSEKHRRRSLDKKDLQASGNDSSSDELVLTPRTGKKWPEHSRSPFADEDAFDRFTADMVRQYIQEEEVRGKHQSALLALRERAIVEKTKAEMAYLEMQKKSFKDKGADDQMPPITKKQRALMMKLQAEQAEIRRLKEVFRSAKQERRSMLNQHKEIQRIRQSTQMIWSKVGKHREDLNESPHLSQQEDSPARSTSEDMPASGNQEVETFDAAKSSDQSVVEQWSPARAHTPSILEEESSGEVSRATQGSFEKPSKTSQPADSSDGDLVDGRVLPDTRTVSEASEVSASSKQGALSATTRSQQNSTTSMTAEPSAAILDRHQSTRGEDDDAVTKVDASETASIDKDIKRLKYITSARYYTEREKKLQERRQQFEQLQVRKENLTDWKRKIRSEERQLKADIQKALRSEKESSASDSKDGLVAPEVRQLSGSAQSSASSPYSPAASDAARPFESDTMRATESDTSVAEEFPSISDDLHSEEQPPVSASSSSSKASAVSEIGRLGSQASGQVADSISRSAVIRTSLPKDVRSSEALVLSADKSLVVQSGGADSYGEDTFEETTKTPKWMVGTLETATKKMEEDSYTEGASDVSDIEQRLRALEADLQLKRKQLQRMRKKRDKDLMRKRELELRKELQVVELQIQKENKENIHHEPPRVPAKTAISSPRVLSPRNSLDAVKLPEKLRFSPDDLARERRPPSPADSPTNREDAESDRSSEKASPKSLSEKAKSAGSSVSSEKVTLESFERLTDGFLASFDKGGVDAPRTSSIESNALTEDASALMSNRIDPSIRTTRSDFSSNQKKDRTTKDPSVKDLGQVGYDESTFVPSVSGLVDGQTSGRLASVSTSSEGEAQWPVHRPAGIYDGDFFGSEVSRSGTASVASEVEASVAKISPRAAQNISVVASSGSVLHDDEPVSQRQESTSSKSLRSEEASKIASDRSARIKERERSNVEVSDEVESRTVSATTLKQSSASLKTRSRGDSGRSEKHPANGLDGWVPTERSRASESESVSIESTHSGKNLKAELSASLGFKIGDRVLVEDLLLGTIKFLGETSFSPVVVAGIELDTALGSNDGFYQGKRYFKCAADFGLFTTIDRMRLHLDDAREAGRKALATLKQSSGQEPSESSTIDEIEESLNQHTFSDDLEHEAKDYSEDFEHLPSTGSDKQLPSSKASRRSVTPSEKFSGIQPPLSNIDEVGIVSSSSRNSQTSAAAVSSLQPIKSEDVQSIIMSAAESVQLFLRQQNIDVGEESLDADADAHSQSLSVSDLESESEIPSPEKLDLSPLADGITDSIMKSLFDELARMGLSKGPVEISEAYITSKETNFVTDHHGRVGARVVADAIAAVLNIRRNKINKISKSAQLVQNAVTAHEGEAEPRRESAVRESFLAWLVDEVVGENEKAGSQALAHESSKLDNDLLAAKLNELKSVHDELGALLGDGVDIDDEDEDDTDMMPTRQVDDLLPFRELQTVRPPVYRIPFNELETNRLVHAAYEEALRQYSKTGSYRLAKSSVPHIPGNDDDGLDLPSTKLFRQLVCDVSQDLLCEIQDFKQLLTARNPPWMKPPKRVYAKFVRQAYALDGRMLEASLQEHVASCFGLREGRPTLNPFKRRSNATKTDEYVDAVLNEELREEEPLWINYDEDELKVKVQLSDSILDGLLDETVDIIKSVLDGGGVGDNLSDVV